MEDKDLNKTPMNEENAENSINQEETTESQEVVKEAAGNEKPAEEIISEGTDATETSTSKEELVNENNEAEIGKVNPESTAEPDVEASESVSDETKEEEGADPSKTSSDLPEATETEAQAEVSTEESKKPVITSVKLNELSKEQLINRLELITEFGEVQEVRGEVDAIKGLLYDFHNKEVEVQKKAFIDEGGEEKDFKPHKDHFIDQMHFLINQFRSKRIDLAKKLESEKENNLKIKNEVIDGIKALTQNPESLNKTFQSFHELQDTWKNTGPVPRTNVKDLYENYHLQVEIFYDYIKINKELRDYDLKKNLEKKLELCEKAEALNTEESELKAFTELQELHKEWRETGPVPKEHKEPLWDRFKEATALVNQKHQKFYEEQRKVQKENFDKKTVLCEKVEEIAEKEITNPKEWNVAADKVLGIQKEWRTIGFAPKKTNNKVYERFRKACDVFFEKKRNFYHQYKDVQEKNLNAKKALIEKAEGMKEREDWKEATEDFIQIQKEWKKVGPVPRKHSDAIWKKFREACDYFFDKKNKFFNNIDESQEDNLKLKQAVIEKVKAFELSDDIKENIKSLNDFKHQWSEIGHVPFKQKDGIYNEFRNLINKLFDQLNLEENDRELVKFQSKLEDLTQARNSDNKLYSERNKLFLKLRSLESDVAVWENNLGFFSNSKDSENLVKDFKFKIEKAKERIKTVTQKIKLIDKLDGDQK